MNILLDENMPVRLAGALRALGHHVETVQSLQIIGIENGALLALAEDQFDLVFTKDADFGKRARERKARSRLRVLRVTLEQKPAEEFVHDFLSSFAHCDWNAFSDGSNWP